MIVKPSDWHVRVNNITYLCPDETTLAEWVKSGRVPLSAFVWHLSLPNWVPVSSLPFCKVIPAVRETAIGSRRGQTPFARILVVLIAVVALLLLVAVLRVIVPAKRDSFSAHPVTAQVGYDDNARALLTAMVACDDATRSWIAALALTKQWRRAYLDRHPEIDEHTMNPDPEQLRAYSDEFSIVARESDRRMSEANQRGKEQKAVARDAFARFKNAIIPSGRDDEAKRVRRAYELFDTKQSHMSDEEVEAAGSYDEHVISRKQLLDEINERIAASSQAQTDSSSMNVANTQLEKNTAVARAGPQTETATSSVSDVNITALTSTFKTAPLAAAGDSQLRPTGQRPAVAPPQAPNPQNPNPHSPPETLRTAEKRTDHLSKTSEGQHPATAPKLREADRAEGLKRDGSRAVTTARRMGVLRDTVGFDAMEHRGSDGHCMKGVSGSWSRLQDTAVRTLRDLTSISALSGPDRPTAEDDLLDGWGNEIRFISTGECNIRFNLWSAGPNGKFEADGAELASAGSSSTASDDIILIVNNGSDRWVNRPGER